MTFPTVESLKADLAAIEASIDDGTYKIGPWTRFMTDVGLIEPEARGPLVEDVSRVSDKLHTFNRPDVRRVPINKMLVFLFLLLFGGLADVVFFLWLDWPVAVWISAYAVCSGAQPLFKMWVGRMYGVKYSHFWLWNMVEPRPKMQYGTYVALPTNKRVILHLAGTVGSAAAFLIIGYTIGPWQPTNALVCQGVGWLFVAMNTAFFVVGYMGVGKIQRLFSGGAAAAEILRDRKIEARRAELKAQAA